MYQVYTTHGMTFLLVSNNGEYKRCTHMFNGNGMNGLTPSSWKHIYKNAGIPESVANEIQAIYFFNGATSKDIVSEQQTAV